MPRSLLLLRIAATVQVVAVLFQTALAGGFLAGHYDLLEMHMIGGSVTGVATILTAVAAFFVRRSGGSPRFLPLSVILVVATFGQYALGDARVVAPHVLLGTMIVAGSAVLSSQAYMKPEAEAAAHGDSVDERPAEVAS